ncbi:glycine--tRNA ligase [candidate division TM6 bacterium RIFCSPHIGHO2_12_FULL_38_8]|nr:MAG: glycine--tRNA ligase [candidate division TM6 bacterium RIFCSPHIGHO2_12_FULL_38_8]
MSKPSSSPSPDTNSVVTLEKIVSLCKRKGFVFPAADIYGGINGIYDFGHLGHLMKENIKNAWKKSICDNTLGNIFFLDGSLIGPQAMWQASGHLANFHDPMIDCMNCKKRFRTDDDAINVEKPCPSCGVKAWTAIRDFNLMFQTNLGALQDESTKAYLRPETAQTIFVQFKNILGTSRTKLPFGVAQIGKAFRNEITPKQFLFRMREFEQMELEWFCKDVQSMQTFDYWVAKRKEFYATIGIDIKKIRMYQHPKEKLSHYSKCTFDVEYEFPFGFKELEGIAHRGTFDLTQHAKHSGKDQSVFDQETNSSEIPTVVETSVGVERLFLTLLFDAYHEDSMDGETRVVLKLHPSIAPIKACVLPLVKKLQEPAEKLFQDLKKQFLNIEFDESGSIGKRYRRNDEIGTPICFTVDFQTLEDQTITARHRDTGAQERIKIDQACNFLQKILLG